ncbi:hypothetical protein J2S00_001357 [Caldalkalibacillus uzonensis]|uniref:Uncharacterized protein n=1 Tax=Caldalkalibacillus uzonensis TaxID=353224 RepID=A0ABU0CQ91_9BACI|nr:hypothetical protein [Caldalkalibacillus uzonensis]MDQ0338571.1 hypothetical protein [Caldalkalibacillus uzonensis]
MIEPYVTEIHTKGCPCGRVKNKRKKGHVRAKIKEILAGEQNRIHCAYTGTYSFFDLSVIPFIV